MQPSNSVVNNFGLPAGLNEQVYDSWRQALHGIRSNRTDAEVELSYQYCIGFIRALCDTNAIEPKSHDFLAAQLKKIWIAQFINRHVGAQ